MAVLVKPKGKKAITIDGLPDFKPAQSYIRLRFVCHVDGKTIEIQFDVFSSKEQFVEGKMVPMMFEVEGKPQAIPAIQDICAAGEVQGVDSAHRITKDFFEKLGYEAIIDLV
jgi:hypothetical protein